MAFIQNQNKDLITELRTENLVLKTQLNIDIPRYVDQINELKNYNNENLQKENIKKNGE